MSFIRSRSKRPRRQLAKHSRIARVEKLESRQLLAADPLGATDLDTGEFFLGTVTVTPVFFESDGSSENHTEDWTEQEITDALDSIDESLQWWSTLLGTITDKHKLDFVIDDTFARDPFETRFEPISSTSQTFGRYVSEFLVDQGLGDSTSVNHGMLRFNDRQRNAPEHQTDWAFTIFMVDASEDPDGFFDTSGDFAGAFAYSGGLYIVTPNSRPTSTIAHEIGHIFWARDEYPGGGSYTDRAGYYNAQNINAFDNPDLEQEPSIMRGGVPTVQAFQQGISSPRTLELIGWRDSDGDGVFDLADVPLDLDISGYFDAESSVYHVNGSASAVASLNQNSRSFRSDITLNEIDRLEYRLDDGAWQTAQQFGQQETLIDLQIPITQQFDTIQLRVVDTLLDDAQGELLVTQSPIVEGTSTAPAISDGALQGYAFIDEDEDGQRGLNEPLLANTSATLTHTDGASLFGGSLSASDYDGAIPSSIPGVTLTAVGGQFNDQVYASTAIDNPDQRVFFARNFTFDRFEDAWGDSVYLQATFDQTVGEVEVSVVGLDDGLESGSYARIEAYDETGNLLSRTTSNRISPGAAENVMIQDPLGRIANVRVLGHARSDIAISDLSFGFTDTVTTDDDGVWRFSNLVPGDYELEIAAQNLIHQFESSTFRVQASGSTPESIPIAAKVTDSPLHNVDLAFNTDQQADVTPADILAVINDLADKGTRILGQDEVTGPKVDVNNDGIVSPLDVLLVINYLSENTGDSGQGELVNAPHQKREAKLGTRSETHLAAGDRSDLQMSSKLTSNHDIAISQIVADTPSSTAKSGVFQQMFNSAGSTTQGERIGNLSTDSQRAGVVFSDSEDSMERKEILEKPGFPGQSEQLKRKSSAETTDLETLRDGFDGNFEELKSQWSL